MQTSIKALIQGMMPTNMEIFIGIVTNASPLEITAMSDEKLIINENTAIVPWYLTDYTTKCDIELRDGTLDSHTFEDGEHGHALNDSGEHTHEIPCDDGGEPAIIDGGVHSHEANGSDGEHKHLLETFNIYNATIRHHNALKAGEMLYILSFNHGKRYFVLDRVSDFYEW